MKTTALAALLFAAVAATAQTPVPFPIGQCTTGDSQASFSAPLRGYRIPGDIVFVPGNFCSAYSYTGWESTMKLHLGEGAEQYLDLIERAVEVWNEAVTPQSGPPLIEIVETRPQAYSLPASFWSDVAEISSGNVGDGESVIYFTPSNESERSKWGYARYRGARGYWMIEADIYINVHDENQVAPDTLIMTDKLVDVDSTYGAYALHNKTYAVILHELGHAIGLKHIPVHGNIMSRDWRAGGTDQWAATVAFELFNDFSPRTNKFVDRHSDVLPYMRVGRRFRKVLNRVDFFTNNGKLGEQDKTALACIYEY